VIARAPTRLDFGGGWTDVPPYSSEVGGFVCNVAIARYATAMLAVRDDAPPATVGTAEDSALVGAALRRTGVADARVCLTSDFPTSAGLGGSSAAGVATVGALDAWQGRRRSPAELAEEGRRLEVEDLGIAGGRQDLYAAAMGGALALRFLPGDRVEARRLALAPETLAALERQCVVAFSC
jgi:D-glycero-alpha-D-manno-heptose-7-phosphate kinase